jgi:hypothetical protein
MTRSRLLMGMALGFLLATAPERSFGQVDLDGNTTELLRDLRAKSPQLAEEFERHLKQSLDEVERFKKGHVMIGRIVLEGEPGSRPVDPRAVTSQMIILQYGHFVDAVGGADRLVGFRLHGYEPVNLIPRGPGPIEHVGIVRVKQLPKDRLSSAKARVQIEQYPGAPKPQQVDVTWSIQAEAINTPHNGTEGTNQFHPPPLTSKVADDGTFSISGMSPASYYLNISAPNCARHWRTVSFGEGESRELDPIVLEVVRKMDVEYLVSTDGNFIGAEAQQKILTTDDRWRVNNDTAEYAWDLQIGQKDGKLLLNYSYGPCHITDLGAAQLADKRNAGPADSTKNQPQGVPVVDGHVYLVHQPTWKHWFLFRVTLVDTSKPDTALKAPALARTARPGAPLGLSPDDLLNKFRGSSPQLAAEFQRRLDQARREIDTYNRGHLVFGRVVVDRNNARAVDPRSVISQMIVLEDGYFVDAVGAADKPIGFRLHGYEPLDVIPAGPGPVEDLGVITMAPLPRDRAASVKGRIQVEPHSGAPRPDKVNIRWQILNGPINTPHNGTEGSNQFTQSQIECNVAPDGTFSVSGMSPAKYHLSVTAPNCAEQSQSLDFTEGESKQLDPITVEFTRSMNVEYVVSAAGDFSKARPAKKKLRANDRWSVNSDTAKYGFDLTIGQKDRKLLLNWSYGPCYITDLGAATLAEKLGAGPADNAGRQTQGVPVEDGHVYLVHQPTWKHWFLFRATLADADDPDPPQAKPAKAPKRTGKSK